MDRLIVIGLLGTIVLAVAGAWLRAAGRRFETSFHAGHRDRRGGHRHRAAGGLSDHPGAGFDERTTVQAGAPLALVVLAVIALASRESMRRERPRGTAWKQPTPIAPEPEASA